MRVSPDNGRKVALTLMMGTALACFPLWVGTAAADQPPPKTALTAKGGYHAPRNSFGQPDLGDLWNSASLTTETRPATASGPVYTPVEVKKMEDFAQYEIKVGNANTDPNAGVDVPNGLELRPGLKRAGGRSGGYNRGWLEPGSYLNRVRGEPRSSFLTTPDGQVPPYKAGVVAPTQVIDYGEDGNAGNSDNPENRTLGDRCLVFGRGATAPMIPNGVYNNNYKIVQTKNEIAIEVEMVHDVRHVYLNRKTHIASNLRPWYGDSIGHWEGDTLVVETTNLPEGNAYHGSWKNLKVTERFTRIAKEGLLYQYTVDDPTLWDKTWGGEYELYPQKGQIYEYACHEGNYAMEGILAGARQIERDQAAAASKAAAR